MGTLVQRASFVGCIALAILCAICFGGWYTASEARDRYKASAEALARVQKADQKAVQKRLELSATAQKADEKRAAQVADAVASAPDWSSTPLPPDVAALFTEDADGSPTD